MKLMKLPAFTCAILLCLAFCNPADAEMVTFGIGPNQFSMDFVPIGNPNNGDDTTGAPRPAGNVEYEYQMGKFEVSEDMITKYNANFGTANGLVVTKDTRGTDKPATSVSWNEAARFVNWLNMSQGFQAAYQFTTSGINDNIELWSAADAWQLGGQNIFRHKDAHYWLPSMDEWYKAAYYDPLANSYSDYATGSNVLPIPVANGTSAGTAVYNGQAGPADVNDAGGLSAFQTMGQGGNVAEWEESEFDLINDSASADRGRRGGRWSADFTSLLSTGRGIDGPTAEGLSVGFRVASLSLTAVPEPNSLVLSGFFGLCGLIFRVVRKTDQPTALIKH